MDIATNQFMSGLYLNGRYETISPLNHGSFGMVSLACDSVSGQNVALKCLIKPSAGLGLHSGIAVDDRSEELKIHSRIGFHPHVVNLLDSFETATHYYLALEYCSNGDLYEAIRQEKGPKQTDHVRSFMHQLIDAVECLHDKGIYHRDIKPENIFLTENGDMKLGDFGLATTDAWSYEIAVGSDRYMAPEQFDPQGNGLSPARADIWSIGICLLNILFSRNPFGEPALSDPLFADFVHDRQSLFDVFPNMSQDTFEVLVHSLAIDPEKRSLALMREALDRVVSFTTDDESLDEFCTGGDREIVPATANREPLRTPSICSPPLEQGAAFPWSQALHMTSPKAVPHMDVIQDEESDEDLFPDAISSHDWNSKADSQSVDSMVDSGLGVSVPSTKLSTSGSLNAQSKPLPIAGSLPALSGRAGNALSSIFGRKKNFESKSWSDLWDEDEEERAEMERDRTVTVGQRRVAQLSQEDSDSSGRSTPRACLAEIKNPPARQPSRTSAKSKDDNISQHTGFVFEDCPPAPKYSPPAKRSFITDKWTALGERRRAHNNDNPPKNGALSEPARKRFSPATWRRNFGKSGRRYAKPSVDHNVWQRKEWSKSTDWRRDTHHLLVGSSPLRTVPSSQLDGHFDFDLVDNVFENDDSENEAEWVGGYKLSDLHL